MIGRRIGNYQLTERIGEGGMGTVYLAVHPDIGRKVAIKLLKPEFAAVPELLQRFFNEARAVSAIGHPHIIDFHDYGLLQISPDLPSRAYIIMEYLVGTTLTAHLTANKPLPVNDAVAIGRQLADALAASHRCGITHRDLKPDNVILTTRGRDPLFVKLLDFGVAKLTADHPNAVATKAGALLGTPTYMSPEQCQGRPVDARTDIYALGVVLYELTTGVTPFGAAVSMMDMLYKHIYEAPVPPGQRRPLPPHLEAVILRALAKDPADRFATMDEVLAALSQRRTRAPSDAPTQVGPPPGAAPIASLAELAPLPVLTPPTLATPPVAPPPTPPAARATPALNAIARTVLAQAPGADHVPPESPKRADAGTTRTTGMVARGTAATAPAAPTPPAASRTPIVLAALGLAFGLAATALLLSRHVAHSDDAEPPAVPTRVATSPDRAPPRTPADHVRALLDDADALLRQGRWAEAGDRLAAARALAVDDAALDIRLGHLADEATMAPDRAAARAAVERGDRAAALAAIGRVLERDAHDAAGLQLQQAATALTEPPAPDDPTPTGSPSGRTRHGSHHDDHGDRATATSPDARPDAGPDAPSVDAAAPPPDVALVAAPPPRDAGPAPDAAAATAPLRPTAGTLDAVPAIDAFDVAGALDHTVARGALTRVLPYLRTCYRDAAQRAQQTPTLTARIAFEVTESRGVQGVKVAVAPDPIGLTTCAVAVVTRIRALEAPDVGTAAVTATIRFQPTK
jgi:serine/threonine-protein kinase